VFTVRIEVLEDAADESPPAAGSRWRPRRDGARL